MALLMFMVLFGLSGLGAGSAEYKGKESWGYVTVRKDAFMFWWLYYADVPSDYSSYPLLIWLQGGPGASSTGYGNFMEIGPFDSNMKPRNTTWVQKANLLFIDNPVGTGFSYVNNNTALVKNNSQIAADLLTTLTSLLNNIPEFQKSPLYIFGESYGGKMIVDFAIAVNKAIKEQKITCNFKGIALGDSWISPFDSVASWSQYLYTLSLINKPQVDQLSAKVTTLKKTLDTHQYEAATEQFQAIQNLIGNMTDGVDFYNVLKHTSFNASSNLTAKVHKYPDLFRRHVGYFQNGNLTSFMNGPVREKLHVIPKNVTWGGQSGVVFDALSGDFMKSVVDSVDVLLNETSLDVVVYSGQLDLIVDTVGTMGWIQNLKWPGLKQFLKSERQPLRDSNVRWGFKTSFKNFNFYWILNAGHMVPSDAGSAALQMLGMILPKRK